MSGQVCPVMPTNKQGIHPFHLSVRDPVPVNAANHGLPVCQLHSSCHPRPSQAFPETFPERRTQAKNPKESLILEQTEWSNHATIKHKIRRQARRQASDSSIPLPCWLSSPLPSWLFSCQTTRQLVCNSAKIQPCFDFGPTFCVLFGPVFRALSTRKLGGQALGPRSDHPSFFWALFCTFFGPLPLQSFWAQNGLRSDRASILEFFFGPFFSSPFNASRP